MIPLILIEPYGSDISAAGEPTVVQPGRVFQPIRTKFGHEEYQAMHCNYLHRYSLNLRSDTTQPPGVDQIDETRGVATNTEGKGKGRLPLDRLPKPVRRPCRVPPCSPNGVVLYVIGGR